jgi:hypothetical protein
MQEYAQIKKGDHGGSATMSEALANSVGGCRRFG